MTPPEDRDPQLIWTEAGEPRSGRYGDVYFSAEDGLAESRAVFLQGCGLPEAWADRSRFTVAELGLGSGLNIVALLDLWRRTRPEEGRLNVFSIEGYPLSAGEARRALSNWPEIAEASEALLAVWPPATPGFHRIDLPAWGAVVDIAVGEVEWALTQWSGHADAWFLDGFAPSTNPDMWSDAVLDRIAARSAPDARIATFTVAGAVRRGLAERGFAVEKRPGHGRKRERLEARGLGPATPTAPAPRVAVVGGGIAGASVIRALRAQGCEPVLIEADRPGAGASGFPAALVTPRFDLGDADIAGLFAQALERSAALYAQVGGAVTAHGVLQMAATDRDTVRFARIADQPLWPQDRLRLLDARQAAAIAGEPVAGPALAMTAAFAVAPAAILDAWIGRTPRLKGSVRRIARSPDGWRVLDADERCLAEVDAVVICAGAGAASLLPDLALSPVRGQAEWAHGAAPPAMAWGGYVAPTDDGFLFGATHDRDRTDVEVSPDDTARNLATLSARLPELAASLDPTSLQSRAAVRATTRDRLPVVGEIQGSPGLFVLGGLGSRGFCLAPLLGEHLAALILDAPSPLPASIAERLSPSRSALAQPLPIEDA